MMNRAEQNWPKDEVIEILEETGKERVPNPFSPYQHVLNAEGTACSLDCPACIWADSNKRG